VQRCSLGLCAGSPDDGIPAPNLGSGLLKPCLGFESIAPGNNDALTGGSMQIFAIAAGLGALLSKSAVAFATLERIWAQRPCCGLASSRFCPERSKLLCR